jgi:sulfur dioxygenase
MLIVLILGLVAGIGMVMVQCLWLTPRLDNRWFSVLFRTDFQSCSSAALYDSVVGKLFTLADATRVWPGHDYKGQSVSTIGWEKRHNARLANRSKEAFAALMAALDLPKPKLIDIAVPANQDLGLPHGA